MKITIQRENPIEVYDQYGTLMYKWNGQQNNIHNNNLTQKYFNKLENLIIHEVQSSYEQVGK